jgi:NTE family protein
MRPGIAAVAVAVAAAVVAAHTAALAQEASREQQARPVIGLVLSGGAARGGAHLGVIKALEELRVPVDV